MTNDAPYSVADLSITSETINLTTEDFLCAVYGVPKAPSPDEPCPVVVSFVGNPNAPPEGAWSGGKWGALAVPEDRNNFFSQSSFRPSEDGQHRRRKEHFHALYCFVLDDVGTKVPLDRLTVPPSWLLESSPGNFQAGYILREPLTDGDMADKVMGAFIRHGLTDPGMTGPLTRLVRLPVGVNGKHSPPFPCRLTTWAPERRYSIRKLLDGFQLDLEEEAKRSRRVPSQPEEEGLGEQVLVALRDRGLYKGPLGGGKHTISCPWIEEHTDAVDNGAAYFEPDDKHSSGGFKCHHGHCADRHIGDLLRVLHISIGDTLTSKAPEQLPWPVLDPAAYHGVIGQFVKDVEPYSEADPIGLLLHTLQGFGCRIGRGPHVLVEHLPHHARLNVLLVGLTGNARKGTAWSTPKLMFRMIDEKLKEEWVKNRVRSGLSSGEGLIYNVRDAEGDDPGETDKRLLIIEQEFAGALQAMRREGNTLSARIRDAWDHGTLTPMTKRDRLTATEAHICIMGHITVTELLRLLSETERTNGFANRFLIPLVKRSKFLPSGQGAPLSLLDSHLAPLSRIVERAKDRKELKRDADAEALWARVYPKLEQEMPGLAGSILARGAAQILRLSLIYALSDLEEAELAYPAIRAPHLLAALSLWDYCNASVRYIFGDAIGDPVADRLLRLLKKGPQTGNDLYEAMGKHGGDRDRKEKALELLSRLSLAHAITIPTGGRSVEEWHYGSPHTCHTCAKW
ncbi:MAG: hypothetical protein U0236_10980 [Nitrospira sp.]